MGLFHWINLPFVVMKMVLWLNQGQSTCGQSDGSVSTAPVFTTNLPTTVTFQNTEGLLLPCTSIGRPAPANEWIYSAGGTVGNQNNVKKKTGNVVQNIARILTVFPNNTLWFHPFKDSQYQSGVHATKLRCVASNAVGSIISTEVTVKAVIKSQYTVFNTRVDDVYTMMGAAAILTCDINPPHLADAITVLTWQRGNGNITYGGRFLQLLPRTLSVYNVSDEDAHFHYTCVTLNHLTGDIKYSDPASIYVLDPVTIKPTIMQYTVSTVTDVGSTTVLPCVASGYPEPVYSYRKDNLDLNITGRYSLQYGNLVISDVQEVDDGHYTCKAENSQGTAEVSTTLRVREKLEVFISPSHLTVDAGQKTLLQCNIRGFPIQSVVWYKDGSPLTSPEDPQRGANILIQNRTVLQVINMQKNDQGVYQCFVGNKWETVQTSAVIRLGVARPKIISVLDDKYVNPGENVTLNCTVTGNPQPQIHWVLDGQNILDDADQFTNLSVTELTDVSGNTISTLHLSPTSVALGGKYTCTAYNIVGTEQKHATVYVYGEPFIKPLGNVTVLANSVLQLHCHVSGYPVKEILWMTEDIELPLNHRQHVWSNGTLQVTGVTKSDAGLYTCVASNAQGQSMQRTLHVTVLDPPSIDDFDFGEKKVGDRVSVSCVVSRGDLPLQFEWLKDGQQIPSDLGVVIQHTGAFSSMLSIPKVSTLHSGNYTCVCRNKASSDQVSDLLQVNLPPRWISEPYDTSMILGRTEAIPCDAYGIPSPNITWTKATESPGHYIPVYLAQGNASIENHTVYQTEEGELVITAAQRSDQGHYLCQATNDVGTALGKLIYLAVHLPPYFEADIVNKTAVKGSDISLDCHAFGDLPLALTWSPRDTQMDVSNTRFVHSEKLYNNGKLMTLKILGTRLEDTGVYVCTARNEYGSNSLPIHVLIQDSPSSPQAVHVTDVTHSTVTVSWTAGFDGNAPLLFYLITYQPINGINGPISVEVSANVTQTTLRYLHPALMYHLVVIAENTVGKSNLSEQVVFTTSEAAPTGPPQNVQAFGISEQIIQLVWEPPHVSLQNGKIQGYRVFYRRHNQSEAFTQTTKLSSNGSYEHMNLEGLDMFTRYEVKIQAYNGKGAGPFSAVVMEYTKEGVPSACPESVQAAAMSSQDIYVVWSPPRLHSLHGILQGYKVYYSKIVEGQALGREMSSHTTEVKTVLRGLDRYTVYSIQVTAYTRVGEGVRSEPVFVQTKQDVPGKPSSIKALAVNSTSIIVSWEKPVNCNGILTHYTLYVSSNNKSIEEEIEIDPSEESYILDNVTMGQTYMFEISASTVVGEGMPTATEKVTLQDQVPARIASFPVDVKAEKHQDVYLPCFAVGNPKPVISWLPQYAVKSLDSMTILSSGSLHLKNVTSHNEGKYKCVASNKYGSDELEHRVIILEPPSQPVLFSLGRLSSVLELGWNVTSDPNVKITGFTLMYSSDNTVWDVMQISAKLNNYTIHSLNCGSSYFFKMKAKSTFGDSVFSDIVKMQTTGGVPVMPSSQLLLQHVNSTFAVLNLSTWQTFGCPVTSFTVEVQILGQDGWESVHTHIPSNMTLYQIELQPETWYLVKVTAHSQPGSITIPLKFATKSYSGSTIGPIGAALEESSSSSHRMYYLVIGVTASILFVIVVIVWLVLHFSHRRIFSYRATNVTSGFKRDGTITDMSLLPESDKEMDMSVISSSEDTRSCPARSHYSRTPTRVLNVSALARTHNPVNRHSHISYSGSEESFQSEKDGKIVPYATFAPTKPPGKQVNECTPLKAEEGDIKPPYSQGGQYINTQKSAKTDDYYLSPLTTTSVKHPVSTEEERKPLMT